VEPGPAEPAAAEPEVEEPVKQPAMAEASAEEPAAAEPTSGEPTEPTSGDPADPASGDPADPASGDPAEPPSGDPASAKPPEPPVWPPKPPEGLPKEIAQNWEKAAEKAKPVFEKAQAAEPALTQSVQGTTEAMGGKMIGLEHRLKSAESLTRKIATDMANEGLTEEQAAGRIADSVRYTSSFPPDKLVEGTQATLKQLESEGNQIIKLKNTWLDESSSYKGINVQMQGPDGQVFELQFHTPESFWAKDEGTHAIFEQMRQVPKGSPEWNALNEQQMEIARKLQVPDGIDKIQPIKKAR
jgi:hypothetical protein